jgi:hypothetical protein
MTCGQCGTGFCWHCGLKDSEHGSCIFFTEQLKNPDWLYLTGLMLSPITFLLTFVIFFLFLQTQVPQDQRENSWPEKILMFLMRRTYLTSVLIFVLTPVLWIVLPLFVTWVMLSELCRSIRSQKRYYLAFAVLLPVGYALLLIVILAVVALAMPVGLGYAVWKGIIWGVRKKNPGFMKRKIRLGF